MTKLSDPANWETDESEKENVPPDDEQVPTDDEILEMDSDGEEVTLPPLKKATSKLALVKNKQKHSATRQKVKKHVQKRDTNTTVAPSKVMLKRNLKSSKASLANSEHTDTQALLTKLEEKEAKIQEMLSSIEDKEKGDRRERKLAQLQKARDARKAKREAEEQERIEKMVRSLFEKVQSERLSPSQEKDLAKKTTNGQLESFGYDHEDDYSSYY